MYIVSSSKNMATKADRYQANKLCVNGCVSFSFLQDLIFVFER